MLYEKERRTIGLHLSKNGRYEALLAGGTNEKGAQSTSGFQASPVDTAAGAD